MTDARGDRARTQACLRFASSIGKALAVIAGVTALYIALIVAMVQTLLWFVLSDFDIDAY